MARKQNPGPSERIDRLAPALMYAARIESRHWAGEVELTDIRIRMPADEDLEVMIVLKGIDSDGTPVVGFHSAIGMLEALAGALKRMATGHIKWRVDEYAQGRGNSQGNG